MKRYWNTEALVEGMCCLAYAFTFFYLAYSGQYLLFVMPRMKPYLYFTAVVALVWALLRLKQARRPKYRPRIVRCMVLVFPVMAMLLPYGTLDAGSVQAGYRNEAVTGQSAEADQSTVQDSSAETGQSAAQDSGSSHSVPAGLDMENRTITVADEDFYLWLVELSRYPADYEGDTIHMHGTVYRDDSFMEQDEFAVTRLIMSCCVADLAPCGPLCFLEGAEVSETDQWVNVTGIFRYDDYRGLEIVVEKLEDAGPARQEYLYPY